jgi:hypothetical protein
MVFVLNPSHAMNYSIIGVDLRAALHLVETGPIPLEADCTTPFGLEAGLNYTLQ